MYWDRDYYSRSCINLIIHQASQRLTNTLMNKCIVKRKIPEYQLQHPESSMCSSLTLTWEGTDGGKKQTRKSWRKQPHLHTVYKMVLYWEKAYD